MATVVNQTRNTMVAESVERATRFPQRLKGLLGRKELLSGHGLWIDSCNSIHTFFMQFAIDAVFLSAEGRVLKTYENLKPYRMTRMILGASSVLELPAGTLREVPIEKGDLLTFGGSS